MVDQPRPLLFNQLSLEKVTMTLEDCVMIRLGAEPSKMREIELDDVFLSRLQLLIIMSKAYLSGYPLGRHRIKSILENAHHVKVDAVGLEEDLEWFEADDSFERMWSKQCPATRVCADSGIYIFGEVHESGQGPWRAAIFLKRPEDSKRSVSIVLFRFPRVPDIA